MGIVLGFIALLAASTSAIASPLGRKFSQLQKKAGGPVPVFGRQAPVVFWYGNKAYKKGTIGYELGKNTHGSTWKGPVQTLPNGFVVDWSKGMHAKNARSLNAPFTYEARQYIYGARDIKGFLLTDDYRDPRRHRENIWDVVNPRANKSYKGGNQYEQIYAGYVMSSKYKNIFGS